MLDVLPFYILLLGTFAPALWLIIRKPTLTLAGSMVVYLAGRHFGWNLPASPKAATNLNVVQPKLFQASRQDDLRFSDCTVSIIQILDDADAAFRISGAELRTVLSATTMLADKPRRLNVF